jgi:hypothetical protein
MDPFIQFLKKRSRAHKYRSKLTINDINEIIGRHAPKLRSIQILNCSWPEVRDEYYEEEAKIIQKLRIDLQMEFRKKIKSPPGTVIEFGLNEYLRSV